MSKLFKQISVPQEVHLRRMYVYDALEKLDIYLQDATRAGHLRVRIIHGKGTGVLRIAVHEFLSKHSYVEQYYGASPNEGGGGVTIAELQPIYKCEPDI